MNIILLSGGSGKRLWPLSNDVRSKQFIKIFKDNDGNYESMVQRMYHSIKKIDKNANITIATSKSQVSELINQLGDDINLSIEPTRRDTFPAIALATAYLHDVMNVSKDEAVIVCPVDPYVEDDYFYALENLYHLAKDGKANLTLMGMEPTYPSEKYGYIMPKTKDAVSLVNEFKEKPTEDKAKEYIKVGALWNAGIFAYKIGYVLEIAHKLIDFSDYYDLFNKYDTVKKISFDYAVVEHENSIQVMRFNGLWKDLGTWNTLTEAMNETALGNVILNNTCTNVKAINDLDIPLVCMGLENLIVVSSPEGILVTTPDDSAHIKPIVEKLDSKIKYAEKSWGKYQVIDFNDTSITVKIVLNSGHQMSYHSHKRRDEVWTIVSGKGIAIVDGMSQHVYSGDVITIEAGCRHTLIAETDMQIIEVQLGTDIDVKDKEKYEIEK